MKDLKDYYNKYNKDNKKFYRQMRPLDIGKRLLWRSHPTKNFPYYEGGVSEYRNREIITEQPFIL